MSKQRGASKYVCMSWRKGEEKTTTTNAFLHLFLDALRFCLKEYLAYASHYIYSI